MLLSKCNSCAKCAANKALNTALLQEKNKEKESKKLEKLIADQYIAAKLRTKGYYGPKK